MMKKRQKNPKIILKIETGILILVTVISITIAWFVRLSDARARDMSLQISTADYLKVALEQGGKDVLELQGNDAYISINMPEFYDLEAKKMAPGVYGHFDLYITAKSPVAKNCEIYAELIPEFQNSIKDNDEVKSEINNLLKGHIQFYTKNENGTYSGLIEKDNKYVVPLKYNSEEKVTIYWVWFYEYTDIPQEGRNFLPENYFEKNKYQPALADTYTEKELVNFYDYADTRIGLGVDNIMFKIYIDALQTGDNG